MRNLSLSRRSLRTVWIAMSACGIMVSLLAAQPPAGENPPPRPRPDAGLRPEAGKGEPRPRPEFHDPTTPSPLIRDLLNQDKPAAIGPAAPSALPAFKLRARIIARGRPGVAILDIGGAMASVREGEEHSVTIGSESHPFRVNKLTADGVELELTKRKTILTLN